MQKLFVITLLFVHTTVLWSMQPVRTAFIYPTLPSSESLSLLRYPPEKQNSLSTPPAYQQVFIPKEESEKELANLRTLLEKKQNELHQLENRFTYTLREVHRTRCGDNIKSNATVGGTAFGYYTIALWAQILGDPRINENGGENESIFPFLNNFGGWVGSQLFAMTQCACRNPNNP